MKASLLKALHLSFFVLALVAAIIPAHAQNALVGTGFTSGWGSSCTDKTTYVYLSASAGTSYIKTLNATGTGARYWRYGIDWSGSVYQVAIDNTNQSVVPNTTYQLNMVCNATGTMTYNVPNASYNYIHKTQNAGTAPTGKFVFFEVQGPVRSVTSVTASGTPAAGVGTPVTATLDGALSAGQAVYMRYTFNNFGTSQVVQMTGSGTTYTGTIPGTYNVGGKTVQYYVFTSGTANVATNGSNADLYTINLNNNGGSNYSYVLGPHRSIANGNWSNPATWEGGVVPSSSLPDVAIQTGHTVTLDMAVDIYDLTINSGATLIGSDGVGRNLNLDKVGGVLVNNGTYTATSTGIVRFFNNYTVSGNPVTFSTLQLTNAVVTLNTPITVNTNLRICESSSLTPASNLTYGPSCGLIYDGVYITPTHTLGNEWDASTKPKNVSIVKGTMQVNRDLSLTGSLTVGANGVLVPDVNAGTHTITMNGSGQSLENQGSIQAYTDASHTLDFVFANFTFVTGANNPGATANPNWRFHNLTINSGATMSASGLSTYNCAIEFDNGTFTNNGSTNLSRSSIGGSNINITTRGTSGNVCTFTGTGTYSFNGLIVGSSSQLNLASNITVKSFMTVASGTPLGSLYPVGNKTVTFQPGAGNIGYYTQQGTVDPNPSFGNTLNWKADVGTTQIQSSADVFSVNVANGGTLKMWENTNDYDLITRNGATVQIDSGGNLVTGMVNGTTTGMIRSSNGGGTFTQKAGGILTVNAAAGINSSGATGPIQVPTRNFSSRGVYVYARTTGGSPVTGTFTTTPTANQVKSLYVSGSSGLALSTSLRAIHRVDLTAASLDLNGNTLTVDSILEMRSNGLSGSAGSAAIANRFVRTSAAAGISLSGNAALALNDTGTTEFYATSGTQTLNARTDYGTIKMTGAATFASAGSLSLAGNWTRTAGGFTPGSNTVTFTGTHTSQTITAPVPATGETFYNLAVNKASGAVYLGGRVIIANTATLTSGKLRTLTDTLELGSTATLTETIGATDHYVVGNLKTIRSVGTAYNNFGGIGMELGAGADVGTVRVVRVSGTGGIVTGQGTCCSAHTSIARNWLVKPSTQPASQRAITLKWPSDDDNGKNVTAIQLWKSPDGVQPYVKFGSGTLDATLTGDPRSVSVYIPSFSDITASDGQGFLPVTWVSFSARRNRTAAEITWVVANEVNLANYLVKSSRDGKTFETIGIIEPKASNGDRNSYTIPDHQLGTGAYYYVVQVDRDGKKSQTETVYVSGTAGQLTFSPNPSPAGGLVTLVSGISGAHTLQLFTADGKMIESADMDADALSAWATAKAATLAPGAYVLQVKTAAGVQHLRWVIEK